MKLAFILFAIVQVLRVTARRYPMFRARLKEKNMVAQLQLMDGSVGRFIEFKNGKIRSRAGIHPDPDVKIAFKTKDVALKILSPKQDYLFNIDAMKNFKMGMTGPEELTVWLMRNDQHGAVGGLEVWRGHRQRRSPFTNNTNGGPFTSMSKTARSSASRRSSSSRRRPGWTITARGRTFTPPHQARAAPYRLVFEVNDLSARTGCCIR